ncbi:hypothetical protein EAF04_009943 [Stromatinia cepivora]|nr:hypothetical protein EAF04_009943 [Stromatinia cepivora]
MSPSTFDVLVEWIYTDRLLGIEMVKVDDSNCKIFSMSWDPIQLYILAKKLLLPRLVDRAMEVVRRIDRSEDLYYSQEALKLIYVHTSEGSNLRQYVTKRAAYAVRNYGESSSLLTTDLLSAMENKDFARNYLDVSRNGNLKDPRKGPGCQFHVDGKDEECPAQKYIDEGKATISIHPDWEVRSSHSAIFKH